MWMTVLAQEVKRQFLDVYRMTPTRTVDGEPCFDRIPDGIYPMQIEGRTEYICVSDNRFFFLEMKEPPK